MVSPVECAASSLRVVESGMRDTGPLGRSLQAGAATAAASAVCLSLAIAQRSMCELAEAAATQQRAATEAFAFECADAWHTLLGNAQRVLGVIRTAALRCAREAVAWAEREHKQAWAELLASSKSSASGGGVAVDAADANRDRHRKQATGSPDLQLGLQAAARFAEEGLYSGFDREHKQSQDQDPTTSKSMNASGRADVDADEKRSPDHHGADREVVIAWCQQCDVTHN